MDTSGLSNEVQLQGTAEALGSELDAWDWSRWTL